MMIAEEEAFEFRFFQSDVEKAVNECALNNGPTDPENLQANIQTLDFFHLLLLNCGVYSQRKTIYLLLHHTRKIDERQAPRVTIDIK